MATHILHLLSIPTASTPTLIDALRTLPIKPLTIGHAHYWISPSHLSTTLADSSNFNVVTILPGSSSALPISIQALVKSFWSLPIVLDPAYGLADYSERNKAFLATKATDTSEFSATATGSSEDDSDLEFRLTPELRSTISSLSKKYDGPVTMLNLVAVHEGKQESYFRYTQEFQKILGPKFEAKPRAVGQIVKGGSDSSSEWPWELVALIHYPTVKNFGKMLDDEAYKELDRTWKKGVVKDNPIICITEIEI